MSIEIQEIPFGTPLYESSKTLREKILRRPLGLSLSDIDLEGEEHQIHIAAVGNSINVWGTVILKPVIDPRIVKLRQMAVDESLRGQGYGRALVESAESIAKKKFSSIEMHARLSALKFYEKLGYEIVGQSFIEVTVPTIKMTKDLNSPPH